MTSESHTAVGPHRRPAPPGPASAPEYTFARPVSYVPDAYDPKHMPAVAASMSGQFGMVYPAQRTGRSVWFALLLIVASVVAFVGWRAQQSGASDSSSGVTYTSAAGHFSARFPAQPAESVKSERHGPVRLVTHTTAVPGEAVVAEVEVGGPIPGDAQRFSRHLVAGLSTIDGSELTSVKNTRFQGSPARQGNVFGPNTGRLFTVLVVARSARRYYLVIAPTGPEFDTLKASFRIRS